MLNVIVFFSLLLFVNLYLLSWSLQQIWLILSLFILQDFPKLNRCRELLSMQEEVKQAKKVFEMDVEKLASIE